MIKDHAGNMSEHKHILVSQMKASRCPTKYKERSWSRLQFEEQNSKFNLVRKAIGYKGRALVVEL